MIDPLDLFWPVVDAVEPVFAADCSAAWPSGTIEQLLDARLIRQTAPTEYVTCPDCRDGHTEEVIVRDAPDGRCRFFIYCPEQLRVEIEANELRRWVVDFRVLTQSLASALSLRGRCTQIVPGRLWRLGRTDWQGTSRDVLLARGLRLADAGDVAARVGQATRPIVLVATQIPDPGIWNGRIPPVVTLSHVSQLSDGQIELEIPGIFAAIHDVAQSTVADDTLDDKKLKRMIRRQVKAEEKTALTDDILVAAYRQNNSLRKAAEFLSVETGQVVSKDRVQRAVERAGGIAAIVSGHDSDSVRRTASLQRQNRKKKVRNRRDAVDFT
jgi:hypothetical protein